MNSEMELKQKTLPIFAGVFLISFSTLMLEIGMTRIFSVLFEYHYAFLAVSLSILGLGAGGIVFHVKLKRSRYEDISLEVTGQCFGLAVLLMIIFIVYVKGLNIIYFTALFAFIPFLFSGIFLSASFERLAQQSGKLYAADLTGAAIGSFLIVFTLKLGGIAVALLSGLMASLISVFFLGSRERKRKIFLSTGLLSTALLILLILNLQFGLLGPIPFSDPSAKEMSSLVQNPLYEARVIDSRWSHFGRTDLVKDALDESEMVFFIDGTAGASMYKFNGDFEDTRNVGVLNLRENYTGYFPISLLPPEEKKTMLIIGPGGGRDILAAKLAGADKITAVEINPDIVKLVREHKDYNGDIFGQRSDISVVVDEGRSFLKRSEEYFDIIFLSIPITKTSRSPEGYALSENFLFTIDSMNDYLEHLNENGRLVVVAHHDLEIFKLLFLALEVFVRKGISPSEALKHIYTTGPPMFQVFVLKKSPITRDEAEAIHTQAMLMRHYQSESTFIPHIAQHLHRIPIGEGAVLAAQMLNEVILGLSEGRYSPEDVIKSVSIDLKPNSDNNPFFYKMRKGLPDVISLILILSALSTVIALLIKPRFKTPRKRYLYRRDFLFRLLFLFLGVGFMSVEIPLIQKFTLFLGHPIYSLSVLLFSLLVGAGLGSYLSGQIRGVSPLVKIVGPSLTVALAIILYVWILPPIFDSLLSTTLTIRILASVGLIGILGFIMGVPFPTGISLMRCFNMEEQVPRMWGINGLSSVFGSMLAISLAITWGFHLSLLIGASLYFLIFVIFISRRNLFSV